MTHKTLILLIGLVFTFFSHAENKPHDDLLSTTKYFSFHNNLWINLHHFMYEKASNAQKRHLERIQLSLTDVGDAAAMADMKSEHKRIFEQGVQYYKKNIIQKSLLNSGFLLKKLNSQSYHQNFDANDLSPDFAMMLNQLKPIYIQYFWQQHKKNNAALLQNHLSNIEQIQDFVIEKMQTLSGSQWQQRVRVDLTTYGNWAGAYSPDFDHIVISSIDPQMDSSVFVELIFHESSHLLFSRQSPFRKSLNQNAQTLNIQEPRNLWHAALFYLAGLATQQALDNINILHELYMIERNVFVNFYTNDHFISVLKDYYAEKIELNETTKLLLINQNTD